MRSRLPSPSESNSVSTQSRCRTHWADTLKAGTTCAWPFAKTGCVCAAAVAANAAGSASTAAAAATIATRVRTVIALERSIPSM
jgi:hypothetical protein